MKSLRSQPPCEAVSWNTCSSEICHPNNGQPPCEAVSWNPYHIVFSSVIRSQPPCEAVSWNRKIVFNSSGALVSLLVRLWVEISSVKISGKWNMVSLLVRLWVEIVTNFSICSSVVRQPPCEAVSWNVLGAVDTLLGLCQPPCEAVSWNNLLDCIL